MKIRDYVSIAEINTGIGFICFVPFAGSDWLPFVMRFAGFLLFLDGLKGFRSGISREIDEKTKKDQ